MSVDGKMVFRHSIKYFSTLIIIFSVFFCEQAVSQIEARQILSQKINKLSKYSCAEENLKIKKQISLASMLVVHGEVLTAKEKLKELIPNCKIKKCILEIKTILQ